MKMKRIDSPLDAALSLYQGDPRDPVLEIILKIAAPLKLPLAVVTSLRDHFSTLTRQKRIAELLLVFKSEVEVTLPH